MSRLRSFALAPSRQRLLAPLLLLGCFFVLAGGYRSAIPLFEGPDESSHIEYAVHVAEHGRLPRAGNTGDDVEVPGTGHQPPLYYVLAAPLVRWAAPHIPGLLSDLNAVNRLIYRYDPPDTVVKSHSVWIWTPAREFSRPRLFVDHPHLKGFERLRWLSLLFGLSAVLLTFLAARRLTGDPGLAVLSAGLLAFNPQFLFVSSYVNNDTLAASVGAATFWVIAAAFDRPEQRGPRRYYAAIGALIGLGLMTKLTTLPGLAVAGCTLFFADARPMKQRWGDVGITALTALVIAGPYLLAHPKDFASLWGIEDYRAALIGHSEFGGLWHFMTQIYWDSTFESYWARFGWMNVPAPKPVYLIFFAITWTGMLGLLLRGRRRADIPSPALKRYVAGVVLTTVAAHAVINFNSPDAQGRHLFAAAPQLAFLIAAGWARLLGTSDRGIHSRSAVLLLTIPLLLSLYCWLGVLRPAY